MLAAATSERGGKPAYTPYHVLSALRILSQSPIGRPQLARLLRLGESPVKTLLHRLSTLGLIERRGGRGRSLTPRGLETVSILDRVLLLVGLEAEHSPFRAPSAVVFSPCIDPPRTIVEVCRVRDYLVEYGCRETVIGGIDNCTPYYPLVPRELQPRLDASEFKHCRGIIIVVPEKCTPSAVSAILRILAESCPREPRH